MKKLLWIPAMLFAAHAAHGQTSAATDPSAAKSRAEVKAETRASGAVGTKNIEVPRTPSTKGSNTSRASVKAETRASGTPVTDNIDTPAVPSTKGSGLTRAQVKASERASGSMGTKNTEVPATPGNRRMHKKDKAASSEAK